MSYGEGLGIVSVIMLVMFIGIYVWAFHPSQKNKFDEAARTPLEEDEIAERAGKDKGEP